MEKPVSKAWEPVDENTLNLKLGYYSPGSDFNIRKSSTLGMTYIPGVSSGPFFEIGTQKISLSLHNSNPPTEEELLKRGRSNFNDFQLRLFGHKTSFELLYQDVHGFVLQDWPTTDPDFSRPDIRTKTIIANFFYSFDADEFSNAVVYGMEGFQRKTGDSFYSVLSVGEFKVKGDKPLVPSTMINGFGDLGLVQESKSYFALGGLGYGIAYPFLQNYFFSMNGLLGIGVRQSELTGESYDSTNISSCYRIGVRPAIGVNFKNWFSSFSIMVDSTNWKILDSDFQQATYAVKFFIGYRFGDNDFAKTINDQFFW